MKFSSTTLLSLLLLTQSLLCTSAIIPASLATCQAACGTPAAGAAVFAVDLNYYASSCLMTCQSSDNYAILTCGALSQTQCIASGTEQNREEVCSESCYRTVNGLLYCGSAGLTYCNLCKAQCATTTVNITQVYDCNSVQFPRTDCARKCMNLFNNKPLCQSIPDAPVCATDGIIYRNTCEMNDVYASPPVIVAVGVAAGSNFNSTLCYTETVRLYPYTGVSAKPVKPAPNPTS